jgi:hypothetical protein
MSILVPPAAADSLTTDWQKAKTLPLITLMTLIFTDHFRELRRVDIYPCDNICRS